MRRAVWEIRGALEIVKEINRDRWCIDTIPAEARAGIVEGGVLSTPLIQLPPAEGASVSTTEPTRSGSTCGHGR